MSDKEKSGHNVRFEQPTLDEQMEGIFESSSGNYSLPKIKDEDQQPDNDGHYFDENDYQLHRKESYPQMHNFLKPLYKRPSKRKKTSPASVLPGSGESTEGSPHKPPEKPQISVSEPDAKSGHTPVSETPQNLPQKDDEKVAFYIDDDTAVPSEDKVGRASKRATVPSSPSTASVEALAFQAQSPGEPIPSAIDRHKVDQSDPSSGPVPSLRVSKLPNRQPSESIPETPTEDVENDKEKLFKKSVDHKKAHHKTRKPSKQEDPMWRQKIGSEMDSDRRIPVIDESDLLYSVDVENLASHRFGEIRGARRYKIPSRASAPSFGKVPGKDDADGALVPYPRAEIDHRPHEVFVQLNELHFDGHDFEWAERARFIKYEEDVEEGTDRWGKPHVASLSFHSLLSLRHCLEKGTMLLDVDEIGLNAIYKRVVEALKIKDIIRKIDCEPLLNILMLHHSHMNDKKHDMKKRNFSYQNLQLVNKNDLPLALFHNDIEAGLNSRKSEINFVSSAEDVRKHNSILRRIPEGSEAIAVNIGAVDFLESPAVAFVRLARGQYIPSVTEVSIPVRFFFILIGPSDPRASADMDYHEVGRSISALMKNMTFHQIAYKASERKELLSGINQFLDESIVLPPGDWEKRSLLPVQDIQRKHAELQRRRSIASQMSETPLKAQESVKKKDYDDPMRRTGRFFGGLLNEIKRRYPLYLSDIKDGLNFQCVAAFIFMYFAALSGAITFGGLYGEKTRNMVGVTETLLLNCVCGILFALLSGQPTVIVGVTGPVLLFDESLFLLCDKFGIEFLPLRVWISIWILVIGIVLVAFDGSMLVKYFTRFTQEIFSALISLLFIYEAFYKLYLVFLQHPLISNYCFQASNFSSIPYPETNETANTSISATLAPFTNETLADDDLRGNSTLFANGTINFLHSTFSPPVMEGVIEELPRNQPNTALISTIMMLGTFFIAYYLRHFRNSKFLGRSARRALGDFGIPIAIIFMAVLDVFLQDTYTMKLRVPEGLSNSDSALRGWIIPPMGIQKPLPIWNIFAAILPALLLFILFFMETEICQLILSRKQLNKGSGFHLDLLLLCFMCLVCGIMGGPWLIAATVRSVSHVSSLTVLSRTHAPGETPKVIDVKDQRVTGFMVYFLIGLSVLMAKVLRQVPVAVLFGVFLYMGVSSMSGVQFLDRILLFFMPVKHHPDCGYVRKVKTLKMHLFTFLQCICLVVLWIVKSTEAALAFPFVLILMVPVRSQFRFFFSPQELKALDCDEAEPDLEEAEPDFYEEALLAS